MARSKRGKGDRRAEGSVWRHRSPHRLLKARERLSARDPRRLYELFEREPLLAEAWALKEGLPDLPLTRPPAG
jgi:hypothetical protein